jgi:hypothetical protein
MIHSNKSAGGEAPMDGKDSIMTQSPSRRTAQRNPLASCRALWHFTRLCRSSVDEGAA